MKFRLIEDYRDDYLKRTKNHIAKVCEYGQKIGKDYSAHDMDKLNELFNDYSLMKKKTSKPGSNIKDNLDGLTKDEENRVNNATFIHITTNQHHPEYWASEKITSFDRENPQLGLHCESMPNEAIDEMLCDWCATSEECGNTPFEWLEKVVPTRWVFTDEQVKYMKARLKELWVLVESVNQLPKEIINLNDKMNKAEYYVPDNYITIPVDEWDLNTAGCCWDFVNYEAKWFRNNNYKFNTYYIQLDNKDDCPTHTFLIFEYKDKYYWFESAWFDQQGIKEYSSYGNAVNDILNRLESCWKCDGDIYQFIYDTRAVDRGDMTPQQYMDTIYQTGQEINGNQSLIKEEYEYWNPTPDNELIDNCYIRALCKCYDMPYDEAQDILPNGNLSTIFMTLDTLGYQDHWNYVINDDEHNKLLTPAAFAEQYSEGTYYIILDKTLSYDSFHMIAIIDGIIYDTSDCSNYSYVLYVWKIK